MLQPGVREILMGWYFSESSEYPAEMKRAYITIACQFQQGNILREMGCDIFFGTLYCEQVILFHPAVDRRIGVIIRNLTQHFIHDLKNKVINLQFASFAGVHQLPHHEMK